MVQIKINILEHTDKVLDKIKAQHKLKNRSEAINFVAKWYASNKLLGLGKKKRKLTDLKPVDWGKGSEKTSEQMDEILYGEQ